MNKFELYNDMIVEIDETDINNFSEIDKKKMKKGITKMTNKTNTKSQGNKKYKSLVAASVIGVAVLGGIPVAASHLLGNLADELNVSQELANFTTVIGQSVVHDGVSITLDEVVLDGDTLVILSTIQSSSPINEYAVSYNGTAYVNGLHCPGSNGHSTLVDDYTIRNVSKYKLHDDALEIGLDKQLDIEVVYEELYPNESVVNPTEWNFAFTADGHSLQQNTVVYPLNLEFILDNGDVVELSHISSNVAGTKVYYNAEQLGYSIDLIGIDNLGNEIFSGGGTYTALTGEGHISLQSKIDSNIYGNISEDVTSITLQLMATQIPEESGRMPEPSFFSEEFTVELN